MLSKIKICAVVVVAAFTVFVVPVRAAELPVTQTSSASTSAAPVSEMKAEEDFTAFGKQVSEALNSSDFAKLNILEAEALAGKTNLLTRNTKILTFNTAVLTAFNSDTSRDADYWLSREKKFQTWMKARPDSAIAIIGYAMALKDHAWAIRGNGFRDTVSREQWMDFHEYLEKAENTLVSNKRRASVNPAWYNMMFAVATALNWSLDDYNDLVNEAIDRFPEHISLYSNALNFMLPQWGGSFELIEQFARSAAEKTKSKYGMAAYALVYESLGGYSSPGFASAVHNLHTHLFEASKADWPTLKQGLKDIIARHPTQTAYNYYAWFAYMAKDKEAATAALQEIKDTPDRSVWRPANHFVACQRFVGIKPNYDIIFPELKESDTDTNIQLYRKYLNAIDELFMGEEFERLEQLYAELNKEPKRFPSGEPVLVAFQQGIMDAMQRYGMDDAYWDALEQKLAHWRTAYPQSELAHVMYGYHYLMRARHVMSSNGYFKRLGQNILAAFGGGYLNEARQYLLKVKDVATTNAIWPLAMLEIGNLQQAPRPEMEAWFSEAAKRGPYQWIVYFCGMREMMQNWKGPGFMDELEQHAKRAVENTKEVEGQALYALVYRELFLGDKSINLFAVTKAEWAHMKQGFDDLNSRYPSSWNLNNYAFFACMAQDKGTTRALLKKIGSKAIGEVWDMVPAMYYRCSEWAKSDD